jgi:Ca2+-transporting ATPase
MNTEMGAIAHMLETTAEAATPLQKEVHRIGRMLGVAVLVIAAVVVATVLMVSDIRSTADVMTVLLLGVSLAVAAVPEGLPAILSLVLALGVQRMAARKAIVKKLSSVETLGSASVICSDKTGTLTRSEMTIEQAMTASGNTRFGASAMHRTAMSATPGSLWPAARCAASRSCCCPAAVWPAMPTSGWRRTEAG